MDDFWNRLGLSINSGLEYLKDSACELTHYNVTLRLHTAEHSLEISGTAQGRVVGDKSDELRFLLGLNLMSEDRSPYSISELTCAGKPAEYTRDEFRFCLSFGRELSKGDTFEICFAYSGKPAANKCWVNSRSDWPIPGLGDGETELCFEGLWLPFANGEFQAPTAEIKIVDVAGCSMLFNGEHVSAITVTGEAIHRFITPTPTFPTVVVGKFESVTKQINGSKLLFYHQPGYEQVAQKTVDTAASVLETIAGWIGMNPLKDFSLIQLKRTAFGQYAPFPFVLFPRDDINRKAGDNDWERITKMLAHEIGHFWFGNLVMSRPDEQWLSEGLRNT